MRKIVQHLALRPLTNKMLTFDHHLVKILTKNSFGALKRNSFNRRITLCWKHSDELKLALHMKLSMGLALEDEVYQWECETQVEHLWAVNCYDCCDYSLMNIIWNLLAGILLWIRKKFWWPVPVFQKVQQIKQELHVWDSQRKTIAFTVHLTCCCSLLKTFR